MKIHQILLASSIVVSIAACDTSSNSQAEASGCGNSCTSSCGHDHASNEDGDFDFAMNSVCQASCGVSDYEQSDIVDITEAEVGDITMCPVSGAIYKVKESSPTLEHDGETFHSCCAGCAEKFKEDPERFYKNV